MKDIVVVILAVILIGGVLYYVADSLTGKSALPELIRETAAQKPPPVENPAETAAKEAARKQQAAAEEAAAKQAARRAAEEAAARAAARHAAQRDAETFSKRIAAVDEAMRASADGDTAALLAAQLADPELNRLARIYLHHDFARARSTFLSKVADAKRRLQAFNEALARNDARAKESIDRADAERRETFAIRRRELAQVDERIRMLEKERSSLERRFRSATEGRDIDRRKRENAVELERLYDRRNRMTGGAASETAKRADDVRRRMVHESEWNRRTDEDRIRNRYRNLPDPVAIREAAETETLKALEDAIAARLAGK